MQNQTPTRHFSQELVGSKKELNRCLSLPGGKKHNYKSVLNLLYLLDSLWIQHIICSWRLFLPLNSFLVCMFFFSGRVIVSEPNKSAVKLTRLISVKQLFHCAAAQLQKNSGDTCPCETPCNLTRYGKELSMVKIPSKGSARYLSRKYDKSEDYIRYNREPLARLNSLMSSDVVFSKMDHRLWPLACDRKLL